MFGAYFEIDTHAFWIAAVFCILLFFLQKWTKKAPLPHLIFSNVKSLKVSGFRSREYFANLPFFLVLTAFIFFLIAFIDPHFFLENGTKASAQPPSAEGIAIYLVLDQSGSMQEKVETMSSDGQRITISKENLLKEVTQKFVQERPNDLIGMVSFARTPQIVAPLTLDHPFIMDQLSKFHVVQNRVDDGTAIGYAIFKTVSIIAATKHYSENLRGAGKPAYDIKSSIIVLVTDGFQDPNLLDQGNRLRTMGLIEAAEYAKSQGIRVYIVNVEPTMASDEYAPQRHQMQQVTQLADGKFYLMNPTSSLNEIYKDIDRLEKSHLPIEEEVDLPSHISKDQHPHLYQRISLYPYLIAIGMLCLVISIVLKTTVLRKVP